MSLILADAAEQDVPEIRDLQIASWRHAYRGMLPDSFLKDGVVEALGERWGALPGADWIVLTARGADGIAGFITVDRTHGPGAYVDNLHVARSAQGQGAGRKLMAAAARRLAQEGVTRLWLTVLRENTAARAFYARVGGVEGTGSEHLLYGQPVFSIPVEWLDLPRLGALDTAGETA